MLTTAEIDRLLEENEYPRYDGLAIIRFARAVEREAYKRAVAECQKIADRHWAAYKGREPLADPSMRANPYVEGESDGAGECADVIEALRSEE